MDVEGVSLEYLDIKQTTHSVTQITNKFIERAMFGLEYASTKKMKMSGIIKYVEDKYYGVCFV